MSPTTRKEGNIIIMYTTIIIVEVLIELYLVSIPEKEGNINTNFLIKIKVKRRFYRVSND